MVDYIKNLWILKWFDISKTNSICHDEYLLYAMQFDLLTSLKCSFFFFFNFILFYNTVFVLPYIDMNPPRVYMHSQIWTPLPPPSPYHPSESSQCTNPKHPYPASNLDWWFVSYMILYMFQCHSPKSSHPLPLPVSLLLSRIQGYHYHLSKFLKSIYLLL